MFLLLGVVDWMKTDVVFFWLLVLWYGIAKSGSIMYVIPRSNGDVVLGGSHEAYQK